MNRAKKRDPALVLIDDRYVEVRIGSARLYAFFQQEFAEVLADYLGGGLFMTAAFRFDSAA
ncbi:hypothetical protein [Burkholderia vietnamiensis]|uniref:KTSC domain-containing protein n=1 Tax=Burkholderia vietnamiensis TaxID=60552 RepID=A0AAW7SYG8_BURVI|nr:hypothetical protein [Burkholderia vietnamiensis]MBR8361557.1 hypothetical protein [Burkholderia vietnamiensis]MDN7796062.1 hypothetical protein [Burkholderia vietnamiensis]HDR9073942.1 hypothetical protein [Burkholderia vietnamiensis]HDR9192473.1 hypothetical protein [Burkholderia vietnamiensis]